MIELLGNCAEIIPDTWKQQAINSTGEIRPNPKMSESAEKNDYIAQQKEAWEQAGYTIFNGSIQWEMFYQMHFEETLDLGSINIFKGKNTNWWIAKVMPGKCFPMHVDSFDRSHTNIERYWIALDDHEWGHIFMIGDEILTGYKKGDIFKFDDSMHGAMNVGLTPKLSLQVLVSS